MRRPPQPTTRRFEGDRGSLLPEFALAAPILIFGLLAIFEFGMGYREKINLAGAVRSAARQATNLGDNRPADYEALRGYQSIMARAKRVTTNRVVIFETVANGAPETPSCLTTVPPTSPPSGGTGVSGSCNIYSNAQIQNLGATYLTNFGPNDTSCSGAWDQNWCPINRDADQGDPGGPDYLGVYANVTYTSWTGLLPTTITITDRAVMRIEPNVT